VKRAAFAIVLALATWACGAQEWPFDVETEAGAGVGVRAESGSGAEGGSSPCAVDGDCPGDASVCSQPRGVCMQCSDDRDCANAVSGRACVVASGRCAECTSNAYCPSALPHCDTETARCVRCLTDADCGRESFCVAHACTEMI
jgi:hypothetical protein